MTCQCFAWLNSMMFPARPASSATVPGKAALTGALICQGQFGLEFCRLRNHECCPCGGTFRIIDHWFDRSCPTEKSICRALACPHGRRSHPYARPLPLNAYQIGHEYLTEGEIAKLLDTAGNRATAGCASQVVASSRVPPRTAFRFRMTASAEKGSHALGIDGTAHRL